jgi:predicted O-methyltransferase YrrM
MPNFTVDWHSHNIPHWRRILERYRGQPNVRALEIGSFEGRSTVWLLENILTHETAYIDCIDTFEGSVEHRRMGLDLKDLHVQFLMNIGPHRDRVSVFTGPSQDILRDRWLTLGPYDFIYIDGSHKSADVLEDAVLSFRLLKIGGLIIFDDYMWNGGGPTEFDNPRRGVEAFYYAYQNQLERTHVYYQAVFQKVAIESRADSQPNLARLGALELVNQLAS